MPVHQETVPMSRRLYLVIEPNSAGTLTMRLSIAPPAISGAAAVLIVRGMLYEGPEWSTQLLADPGELDGGDATGP